MSGKKRGMKMIDYLETSRLILRPFTANDAADAFEYLHEPMVHCFACMKTETMDRGLGNEETAIGRIMHDFFERDVVDEKVGA